LYSIFYQNLATLVRKDIFHINIRIINLFTISTQLDAKFEVFTAAKIQVGSM